MGKRLIIRGADFSANGIRYSVVYGKPNTAINLTFDDISVNVGTTNQDGYLELKELDVYKNNVTSLKRLLASNTDVTKLVIAWDLTGVSNLIALLNDSKSIEVFDMSGCNCPNQVNMNVFAQQNTNLKKVDISNLKISEFGDSFWQCSALKEISMRNCTMPNSFSSSFLVGCSSLEKVDMRGCSLSDIAKVIEVLNAKNVGGSNSWNEVDGVLVR